MKNDMKKNYALLFADTILFVNAMAFLSVNAVITYFLNVLGASTFQVSLASALVGIGTFVSQPIFSKMALNLPYKLKTFVKILSLQRLFFLVFIGTIPLFAGSNPRLMVVIFLIGWGIFNFFTGSYSPFYMSLLSKMIPHHQRGRLLGFSGAVANILALGSAYAIGILLYRIPFPYNYTVIFGMGTILLLMDNVDFALMKETPDKGMNKQMSYFQYIKDIPSVLTNNKRYAKMVAGYSFFVIANVGLVYYALYAIRTYHAKSEEIALFTALAVAANTLGNILFGILADRFSHKLVLQLASICAIIAAVIILSIHHIFAVYAAFIFSTLCSCGYLLSSSVFIIQNSPQDDLPVFIGVNVMITLTISSFVTMLSSFIIDSFSFGPIFMMTGMAGFGALFIFSLLNVNRESI